MLWPHTQPLMLICYRGFINVLPTVRPRFVSALAHGLHLSTPRVIFLVFALGFAGMTII